MNLNDIARKLNVSRWTVSRVINNDRYVKKEKREKIARYLKKANYVPNYHAAGLAGKKSKIVCLVIPSGIFGGFDSFFVDALNTINSVLEEKNYYLMTVTCKKYDSKRFIELSQTRIVCGFIILGPSVQDMAEIKKLRVFKVPAVILFARGKGLDSFASNNAQGAYEATKYLIREGYKKIAFIHGHPKWVDSADRYRGFKRALKESKMNPDRRHVLNGYFDFEEGKKIAQMLLESQGKPDAIFAANDKMALGAISAATEMGLGIPKDVAVVGFDNISESKYSHPPLTTVMQPIKEIARDATLKLIEMCKNGTSAKPVEMLYDPVFVKRESA